ncbi:signal transduction histidine kinase [Nonomuraea polychroma]|uniref:histidine kinase n=1 Tax=Nonomuraea polychroma TaxID=46176 RepID=A0A438MKZ7_9ACTN|nr:HAMP domain-containing sensor histidine kinase [Nonomuraea polychroma]RVX46413.1 signal transduction histidine kinase [Nonomuraea polychroma]
MRLRPRLTIRARLTLLYCATFTAGTAAALAIVYLLMSHLLTPAVAPTPALSPGGTAPVPTGAGTQVLDTLLLASGVALVVCALGAAGVGWLVVGRMLAPIRRITATAGRIAGGSLDERVSLQGPYDELTELANTFDSMLSRLQAAFEGHRRFAANASHELLTPLATSQALLDLAAADPSACDPSTLLAELTEVNERSERIVTALLDLARAENGVAATAPADLAGFARDAIAITAREAAERGVSVTARLDTVLVDGDPTLLRQLAVNLVANAIRHNHPGGLATVEVGTDQRQAVITVTNTGPRVTPERVEVLFEPFARGTGRTRQGDAGRPGGHGLGLAIVRAVATAHRGTLTATANPGGGLTVHVRLARSIQ